MTHPLVHVVTKAFSIVQTPCQIRHVRWTPPTLPCDRCGSAARRVWEVARTAIDLDLDAPVLLRVVVSAHQCRGCRHHFRAQPPFLRPDALYTNRIVAKAIQAVFVDGLAFRRVPDRLARDFWVRPTEGMVRAWCRAYSTHLEDQESYLPWVVEEFSGILCVDEVYQGALALLLAVDPAAPSGDRLVGYQLVDGTVGGDDVAAFLRRLKNAGICPEEVITDGSTLYPAILAEIWPTAAHQLCLFHETRHVTDAVAVVVSLARGRSRRHPLVHGKGGVDHSPQNPRRRMPTIRRRSSGICGGRAAMPNCVRSRHWPARGIRSMPSLGSLVATDVRSAPGWPRRCRCSPRRPSRSPHGWPRTATTRFSGGAA